MRDLVRESSGNLLEEFEGPSDLLERPTGNNSTVLVVLVVPVVPVVLVVLDY